jgi:hypothetical protein
MKFRNTDYIITANIFIVLVLLSTNLQAQQIKPSDDEGSDLTLDDFSGPAYRSGEEIKDPADTLKGWKLSWLGGLHGSQASYSNWSSGGVNAVSATASTLFNALYRKDKWGYHAMVDLKYGRSHLANQGSRKTDDDIDIENKVTRNFNDPRWNAFAMVNFKSQFDQGFDYDVADDESPVLLSSFFAPAYFEQIVGIGFDPVEYFTVGAGLQLKETIVTDDSLSEKYGLAPGDNFRLESGFTIRLGLEKNILKNVKLKSSFETFTNVARAIKHTDFTFSNMLIGKINDFLNVTFEFDTVYDDDFSKQLQVKEVLAAGLSVTLL